MRVVASSGSQTLVREAGVFFSHVQVWHGEVTRRRPCCITLMLRVGACMVLCYASRGACVRREMQGFVRRCEIVHGVRVREGWTVVH
jgi:hypothetical protein